MSIRRRNRQALRWQRYFAKIGMKQRMGLWPQAGFRAAFRATEPRLRHMIIRHGKLLDRNN